MQPAFSKKMDIKQDASAPQILIYHSHASEAFADSREGVQGDTIVGVGSRLAQILKEKYGYYVIHIKEAFDMAGGRWTEARPTIMQESF